MSRIDTGHGQYELIDPEKFPCRGWDLDPEGIGEAAAVLRGMAGAIGEKTSQMDWAWRQLAGSYQAPEQERVYELMRPAELAGQEVAARFRVVADALETYQAELGWVKHQLLEFEGRAAAFRAEALQGYEVRVEVKDTTSTGSGSGFHSGRKRYEMRTVSWAEYPQARAENQRLLQEYAELLEKIQRIAAACAEVINGQRSQCVAPAGVVVADAIMEGPMVWGDHGRVEHMHCLGRVGGAIGDRAYQTGEDLVRFLVDPEQLDPHRPLWAQLDLGYTLGQIGGAISDVAAMAIAVYPPAWLIQDPGFAAWRQGGANALAGIVNYDLDAQLRGLNPWHRYEENLAGTVTDTVLNLGGIILGLGTAGVGTAATVHRISRSNPHLPDTPLPATGNFLGPGNQHYLLTTLDDATHQLATTLNTPTPTHLHQHLHQHGLIPTHPDSNTPDANHSSSGNDHNTTNTSDAHHNNSNSNSSTLTPPSPDHHNGTNPTPTTTHPDHHTHPLHSGHHALASHHAAPPITPNHHHPETGPNRHAEGEHPSTHHEQAQRRFTGPDGAFQPDPASPISPEDQKRIYDAEQKLYREVPGETPGSKAFRENVNAGKIFDYENNHRYEHNQLRVTKTDTPIDPATGRADPKVGSYHIMDSYSPTSGEIVERKHTQLADIRPGTRNKYLRQLIEQYPPDRRDIVIADTPQNRQHLGPDNQHLIGQTLKGQQILEVPVQHRPPPYDFLKKVDIEDATVRDIEGTTWEAGPSGKVVETRIDGTIIYHDQSGGTES